MSRDAKEQQWRERLVRFERAGQTVSRFCQAEGVSTASFYRWRKVLGGGEREQGARTERGSISKAAFQPIPWTRTTGLRQSTMIRLAAGVEIELGDDLQVVEHVVQSVVKQALENLATRGGASC